MAFRSGYVTVIGVPNAGKSSLVNGLVKESVSIVTSKPQTTRKRTMGILTVPQEFQMVFVDTPGVIESNAGLNVYLKAELQGALKEVDVVIAAIAPWEFERDDLPWVLKVHENLTSPVIFVATQIDKKKDDKEFMAARLARWNKWTENKPLSFLDTSSRTNLGLDELKNKILGFLLEGPQYYDVDIFTPQSMREIAAEVVRKQCFEYLHQEIPYGLAVLVQKFEEGKIFNIEADILLTRESHKPMVIGRGGSVLKQIGVRARFELERIFKQKIFLKLHVVVKPAWMKDNNYMKELGYVSE